MESPETNELTIPGPPPMAVFGSRGNLIQFRRDPIAYMRHLQRQYGDVAAFIGGKPGTIFAFGPKYNQLLLGNSSLFHSTGLLMSGPKGSAQHRIGYSLFSMNGEEHMRHRKLIMPPFHRHAIETYRQTIVQETDRLLGRWSAGKRIDLSYEMKNFMVAVAGKVLLDFDDEVMAREIGAMIDHWTHLSTSYGVRLLPKTWPGMPYQRMLRIAEKLETHIAEIISQRRQSAKKDGVDMLSMLLQAQDENGGGLTNAELLGHTNILFAAAHETTSNALTWTLFLLAQHPKILDEVREELNGKLKGSAPTMQQFGDLWLLDCVIKESLRILPPGPYSSRTSTGPFEMGPYRLPAKTTVVFSHYMTHHMAEIFPEPEAFRPERWVSIQPSPYEYMPFGAGAHGCLGAPLATMILKVALAMILQRFQLSPIKNSQINRSVTVTLSPANGMPMMVELPRKPAQFVPVRGNIHEMVQLRRE